MPEQLRLLATYQYSALWAAAEFEQSGLEQGDALLGLQARRVVCHYVGIAQRGSQRNRSVCTPCVRRPIPHW
jgi:hypothetical protein